VTEVLSAARGVVVVVEQPVMEPIASAAAEATARSLVFMARSFFE
jgi:hypothetical protein